MTENKPIIIDGVDVSNCKWRSNHICWERYLNGERCDNYPNCYFKQLASKTHECEDWKHQAELGSDTTDRLAKQLALKEQECERLKDELSTYGATGICETCAAKSVLQNDKYARTLKEIKKIMKNHCRKCKKHKFYYFQLCCTCKYTDILQKISEVE